ncbi:YxeA family protein [uncultured Enterococcus sp.]|uniref:YxeA family protein n=1 Tax=uncultured Enterococcus sp. TaxID=167972 RepID=UPI002AA8B975|nr:YxeA family protein [uncultured Enterococcus sp.]
MKKTLTGLGIFAAISGILIFGINFAMNKYMEENYGGPSYYTKINGDPVASGIADGTQFYEYDQVSYDEKGIEKTVHLKEYRQKPLRKSAYLKMVVNDEKGVTSWEEVNEKDLPNSVKEKLA